MKILLFSSLTGKNEIFISNIASLTKAFLKFVKLKLKFLTRKKRMK